MVAESTPSIWRFTAVSAPFAALSMWSESAIASTGPPNTEVILAVANCVVIVGELSAATALKGMLAQQEKLKEPLVFTSSSSLTAKLRVTLVGTPFSKSRLHGKTVRLEITRDKPVLQSKL